MEDTFQEAIQATQAKNIKAEELFAQLKTVRDEVSEDWTMIRQRIRDGETSGDKLTDGIILRFAFFDPKIKEAYSALEEKLKEFQGQFIMFVTNDAEQVRFGGPGDERPGDFITRIKLSIGILRGETFIFDKLRGNFFFPTGEKHLSYFDSAFVRDAPINTIGNDLECTFVEGILPKNPDESQIIMGDQEVINWFMKKHHDEHWFKIFRRITLSLEKIVEFPKLSSFLGIKHIELLDEYKRLEAQETFLELECKKLKKSDKRDGGLEKELQDIPQKKAAVLAKAMELGLAIT